MKLMNSKHILKVGAWTGISRIFGFARDMLIARVLGAGRMSDIFLAAFKLPNMFRDLLGEGALSSVFVPMFAEHKVDKKKSEQFAENVFSWLMLILLAITLVFTIFMPIVMMGLVPGFVGDPGKFEATVFFARIMFFYVVFISGAGLVAGILNAFSDFAAAAAMPVLLNLFMIGGLLLAKYLGSDALLILSIAVLLSGMAQMFFLLRRLARHDFGLRLIKPKWTPKIKTIFKRMGIGILGSGFYQVNIIIGALVASHWTGAISWLYYSDRIVQLPFAMIGLAAGTVLLASISHAIIDGDIKRAYAQQNSVMRSTMMLTLPSMVGLFVLAQPIIKYLFEYGAWTPESTYAVAAAIMIQSLALPAMTNSQIYSKTLFAAQDVRSPVKYSAISLIVSTVLYIALAPFIGYLSVPTGTVIGGYLRNWLLYRESKRQGLFKMQRGTTRAVSIFAGLSLIMGAGLWWIMNAGLITSVISLGLAMAVAVIFYLPIAFVVNKNVIRGS
jgi:putative peptidoglycan lipid II flippase